MAKLPQNANPRNQAIDESNIRETAAGRILGSMGFASNLFNKSTSDNFAGTYAKENTKILKTLIDIKSILNSINQSLVKFIDKQTRRETIEQDLLDAKLQDFQTEPLKEDGLEKEIKHLKINELEIDDLKIKNVRIDNLKIDDFDFDLDMFDRKSKRRKPTPKQNRRTQTKKPNTPKGAKAKSSGLNKLVQALQKALAPLVEILAGLAASPIFGALAVGGGIGAAGAGLFLGAAKLKQLYGGEEPESRTGTDLGGGKRIRTWKDVQQDKAAISKSEKQAALEFKGPALKGFSEAQTKAYAANVAKTESGYRVGVENDYGYVGQYQFGAEALADQGLVDSGKLKQAKKDSGGDWYKGGQKQFLHDPSNWTIDGGLSNFLSNKELQDKAFVSYTQKNIEQGIKSGAISEDSDPGDIAAFAKAAHLKGSKAATNLFLNGIDSHDANNTSAADYARQGRASITVLAPEIEKELTNKKTEGATERATQDSTATQVATAEQPTDKPANVQTTAEQPNNREITTQPTETTDGQKLKPIESFPVPVIRDTNPNIISQKAELISAAENTITQGQIIDSGSRNITEATQQANMQPQQPIVINQGTGGGQNRASTQRTPSNQSPMGIEIGARSNEPTLLKAQYNAVRPL